MAKKDSDAGSAWQALRLHTAARIGLGRRGVSLPTGAHLAFQLAHAQARDAVHLALDGEALASALAQQGQACVQLHSAAATRSEYLQRPVSVEWTANSAVTPDRRFAPDLFAK